MNGLTDIIDERVLYKPIVDTLQDMGIMVTNLNLSLSYMIPL